MARGKSDDRQPPRRPRRAGVASKDHAHELAAGEITAKLAQIAESGRPGPTPPPPNAEELRDGALVLKLEGAEVTDSGLLATSSRPKTVGVFALTAFPHPEAPGQIVLRLDGWHGHIELSLPRDRAELLAARVDAAVAASTRGRIRGAHTPLEPPAVRVAHGNPQSRSSRRKHMKAGGVKAIDSALDALAGDHPEGVAEPEG